MKKILIISAILVVCCLPLMWVEKDTPKPREKYSISVGDTTLQVIRKIKIGHEDSKVLDIRTIYPGKNCYYFQLNENVELDVVVMR